MDASWYVAPFKGYEKRYCTLPYLGGFRAWFEHRFGDLCAKHDRRYIERKWSKWQVDCVFLVQMSRRGYPLLAIAAWLLFWSPVGLWHWYTD